MAKSTKVVLRPSLQRATNRPAGRPLVQGRGTTFGGILPWHSISKAKQSKQSKAYRASLDTNTLPNSTYFYSTLLLLLLLLYFLNQGTDNLS